MPQEDPRNSIDNAVKALSDHTAAIEKIVARSVPNYRGAFARRAWGRLAARCVVALLLIVTGGVAMCLLYKLVNQVTESLLTDKFAVEGLVSVLSLSILPLLAIILTCIWGVVRIVRDE